MVKINLNILSCSKMTYKKKCMQTTFAENSIHHGGLEMFSRSSTVKENSTQPPFSREPKQTVFHRP